MKSTILLPAGVAFLAGPLGSSGLPKANTAVLPIKARVGISNNWPDPLRVDCNGQHNIDKKFPDTLTIASGQIGPNPEAIVSANWLPLASSFALTLYTPGFSTVEVQLGKLGYKTQTLFAPANPKYELVTMFAPQKPLSWVTDVDTHLHILSGPGDYPAQAQEIVQDEIPSLNRYLSSTPPKITLTKGVTLTLDGIPQGLTVEYGTLEPSRKGVILPSPDGLYHVTAMVKIDGSLTGAFAVDAIKMNDRFDVNFSNLRVLLKVAIDFSSGNLPKPTVTGLQISLDKLVLSSPTSKAITGLWPVVAGLLGLPTSLAGYINTELNQKILDFANTEINNLISKIGGAMAVAMNIDVGAMARGAAASVQ